jgi:hypothetical protein
MFKIGDFSRFTRVSVKMLRHYDELGLDLHFSDIHTTTMTPQDTQAALADLPSLWA